MGGEGGRRRHCWGVNAKRSLNGGGWFRYSGSILGVGAAQ
jgi:hypothetical protein